MFFVIVSSFLFCRLRKERFVCWT